MQRISVVQTINFKAALDQRCEEQIGHVAVLLEANDRAELARLLSDLKVGSDCKELFLTSLGVRLEHPIITWDVPMDQVSPGDIKVAFGEQHAQAQSPDV